MRNYRKRRSQSRRIENLEARKLLAFDSLMISEFVARNDASLMDADGDPSDWIEIYNPTDEAVNLGGWSLTDDSDNLSKWTFPSMELSAGSYEVVFASDKDRRQPGQELHTNFRLAGDGEYLALIEPNGTRAVEFSPSYPEQASDISYGFAVDQLPLLDSESPFTYQRASAGVGDWNQVDFLDNDWQESSGPIGFDVRSGIENIGFENGNLSLWESFGVVNVQDETFGIEPRDGNYFALIDSTGSTQTRLRAEQFLNLERFMLDQVVDGSVSRVSALKRDITVQAGSVLEFDWQLLTNDSVREDFGFVTISGANEVDLLGTVRSANLPSATPFARETSFDTYRHVFDTAGTFTIGIGVAQVTSTFEDTAIVLDRLEIDGVGDTGSSYGQLVTTDLTEQLANRDESLWLRYEFGLSDPGEITGLSLQTRYDDGFVAYLNGQRVAERNAPNDITWNSKATARHNNLDAVQFESVKLENIAGLLENGKNILAVQGLNHVDDLQDFLWQGNLVGIGQLADNPSFLPRPTPGQPNLVDSFRFVDPVDLSVPAGFYETPFLVSMSTKTTDATIRYTLDGSVPTEANGIVYAGPITVGSSTVVRAVAFRENYRIRDVTTHSYLFVDDVVTQSRGSAINAGFPTTWGGGPIADYAMDRDVIGPRDRFGGKYAETVRDDLLSLPSLSIVMDQNDLFGQTGIYSNPQGRGEEWERPTSVELIHPDGTDGFQIDAGLRIQGGISRQISSKLSMRLIFRDSYGASKLDYPFFGSDGPAEFDSISLRSSSGEHFVGIHYIRDEFVRRTQLATGNPAARGTFMHLYINGIYWGLYNPAERIGPQFAVNYDGGNKGDYDVYNAGDLGSEAITVIDGTDEAWMELVRLTDEVGSSRTQSAKTAALLRLEGQNADGTDNDSIEAYLDIDNFIDYLIVNVYAGNRDWPFRNYYMYRQRGPESDGFKFFVWDAEFSLDGGVSSIRMSDLNVGPTVILPSLLTSDSFRVRFADRAQHLFSPGGPLYVNPSARVWNEDNPQNNVPASRYVELANEIRSSLVPESARWGDEMGSQIGGGLFTPDEDWETIIRRNLRLFFPSRSAGFLNGLRSEGLYKAAPEFSIQPGNVSAGTEVSLETDDAGAIYYTLDGTDPRLPDGSISDTATRFARAISVTDRTSIQMRSFGNGTWSAITGGTFLVDMEPANSSNLRISEINYNPHDALTAFGEDSVDNDLFEFVELKNTASTAIDLTGIQLQSQFGKGIDFEFGLQSLAAGESVVIPRNRSAFLSRYGDDHKLAVGVSLFDNDWQYEGSLSNNGDLIAIVDAGGHHLQTVSFDDSKQWPGRADGNGSSLEPIDVAANLSHPANWRSSSEFGGSPGRDGSGPDNRVVLNEVRAHSLVPAIDQIELKNTTDSVIDVRNWYLSDSSRDYFKYQFDASTPIAANGYWTLLETEFGFDINGPEGDDVYLIEADDMGRPLKFVDRIEFGPSAVNSSLGRWPDGAGRLYPTMESSFGVVNSGPYVGDVIISEIQASANIEGVDGISNSRDLEFVELYNRTDHAVDLSNWQISGDIDFMFSEGTSLPAGQTLTLVGFDPIADPVKTTLFGLLYEQFTVAPIGPYEGAMDGVAGTIRLTQPLLLGLDEDPQIVVDEVRYDTVGAWPQQTIDSDNSINRTDAEGFGSSALSWNSSRATPGKAEFSGLFGDLTNDGTIDIHDINAMCVAIRSSDANQVTDINGDGSINADDLYFLVVEIMGTTPGDSNLDGIFNSKDLVAIFQSGTFEDNISGNSSWADGDWNCDGDFTTTDLVVAFQFASYSPASTANDVAARIDDSEADAKETARESFIRTQEAAVEQRPRQLDPHQIDHLFAS